MRQGIGDRSLAFARLVAAILCGAFASQAALSEPNGLTQPEIVTYVDGERELRGYLYRPPGDGPFPALVYSHGSAPGLVNNHAFDATAPLFVEQGWIFFAPYRRGQGLSTAAGHYIMDEIAAARKESGRKAAAQAMADLLSTDHLEDQTAALAWARAQPFVRSDRVAVMGNSFGGVISLLLSDDSALCAVVSAAGGARSWRDAEPLRDAMLRSVRSARTPVFFFQAENDNKGEPSRRLAREGQEAGRRAVSKVYPPFGRSAKEGHSFPYRGVEIWRDDVPRFLGAHCAN